MCHIVLTIVSIDMLSIEVEYDAIIVFAWIRFSQLEGAAHAF